MSRALSLLRRLEAASPPPGPIQPQVPPPTFRRIHYTFPEWDHFVVTRCILHDRGLEAALAWMHDHPRPPHVPTWVLESEARSRDFPGQQGLPPIPELVPDDLPDAPGD